MILAYINTRTTGIVFEKAVSGVSLPLSFIWPVVIT